MGRLSSINIRRPSKGEKHVPKYNAQEQATLRMADAFTSILGAVAMRSEDKAAVVSVIADAQDLVHQSYVERTNEGGEVAPLFPSEGDNTLPGGGGTDTVN